MIRARLRGGISPRPRRGELSSPLPVGLVYDAGRPRDHSTPTRRSPRRSPRCSGGSPSSGRPSRCWLSLRERRAAAAGCAGGSRTGGSPGRGPLPCRAHLLTNPAYAGAFVFGRTRTEKRVDAAGKLLTTAQAAPRPVGGADPRSPPRVHRLGHLRGQHAPGCGRTGGRRAAGRRRGPEGPALLQGLALRQVRPDMQTGYSGARQSPRYVCARAKQLYVAERGCQHIVGGPAGAGVLAEVFAVLEPAALDATGRAAERRARPAGWPFELAVDGPATTPAGPAPVRRGRPENRLVARTLEHDWKTSLPPCGSRKRPDRPAGPPARTAHRRGNGLDDLGRR